MQEPPWFREIDHTADIGIELTAPDLKTLFERAAWGLFSVLVDVEEVQPREEETVVVEGADREDLLVRWLSELNFRHATHGRLFSMFELTALGETRLAAVVRGEPIDPERHTIHTEIKAITYHGLTIRRENGAWHVRVIFDL